MFCTVISRNESQCISVPVATWAWFVQKKCIKTSFSFFSVWAQRRVWVLKAGRRRITVWWCSVLLCIPAVKSVIPENICKFLGFEHHRKVWQKVPIPVHPPNASVRGKATPWACGARCCGKAALHGVQAQLRHDKRVHWYMVSGRVCARLSLLVGEGSGGLRVERSHTGADWTLHWRRRTGCKNEEWKPRIQMDGLSAVLNQVSQGKKSQVGVQRNIKPA